MIFYYIKVITSKRVTIIKKNRCLDFLLNHEKKRNGTSGTLWSLNTSPLLVC